MRWETFLFKDRSVHLVWFRIHFIELFQAEVRWISTFEVWYNRVICQLVLLETLPSWSREYQPKSSPKFMMHLRTAFMIATLLHQLKVLCFKTALCYQVRDFHYHTFGSTEPSCCQHYGWCFYLWCVCRQSNGNSSSKCSKECHKKDWNHERHFVMNSLSK